MSDFEEWFQHNFIDWEEANDYDNKTCMKRAWNGALREVQSLYNLHPEDIVSELGEIDSKIEKLKEN